MEGAMTLLALLLSGLTLAPAEAIPSAWKDWTPIIGEWVADPGKDGATGAFTLAPDLQGRVLVRHNFAEYPKSEARPGGRHDDLMVIYRLADAIRADYWDSEGHVIHYGITVEKDHFTFLSDVQQGQPRFRLSYAITKPAAMSLVFEIAPPGKPDAFAPYIKASLHRK
jgi:hypothetical protein